MNKTETKRRKPRLLRWFWILLVALMCPAMVGIFLCRYTPRAYRPEPVDNPRQVSRYLTHQLGPDFYDQVQLDKPFEFRVEQDGLNDILRHWPWPQKMDDLSFSDPIVLFDEGVIYLMGTVEYKGTSSVLTIIARPAMIPDGNLSLNIESIRLGILPARTLIRCLVQHAFDASMPSLKNNPQLAEIIRAVIHEESFDPVFDISGQKVKIIQVTIEAKVLILQLRPQ